MSDGVNHLVRNRHLVEDLGGALRSGQHGLSVVPGLLKRVLVEGSWRDFETQRGELVHHDRFGGFVTTPPLSGIGATVDLLRRIVADDMEALDLLDRELQNPKGRPINGLVQPINDGKGGPPARDRSSRHLRRLREDFPDLHAAVLAGSLSTTAAATKAGIYPQRVSVNLNDPRSAAHTLRAKANPEFVAELRRLLDES